VILSVLLLVLGEVVAIPQPPFEFDCPHSQLCSVLWTLVLAGAVTGLLFAVEFILNSFRDTNRSS
jgi:hypothetical protein